MKIYFEWNKISDQDGFYTYRAKVVGGWIVQEAEIGLIFVSDPKHEWEIDN